VDGYASETRIISSAAVRAIAAHYGRHLGAAGWRRTDVVDRPGLSVTRFAGRARNGDAATAVLTVLDLEPEVRLVHLRVVRNEHAAPIPARASRPASALSRGGGAGAGRAGASRTLPSPFPQDLLPAGVEVLSAAGTSARMIVLARVQNFTAGHFARFAFDLEHSGWVSRRPPMAGGFLAPHPSLVMCRPGSSASMDFDFAAPGGVELHAEVAHDPAAPPCQPVRRPRAFDDVPMPFLMGPPDSARGGASGGSSYRRHAEVRRAATLSVPELGAMHSNEIAAAGWTLDASAADTTELFVRRFTLKTAPGETLVGLLTLMAMPDATIDAALTIHRPSR
jgi:hypothetical protein